MSATLPFDFFYFTMKYLLWIKACILGLLLIGMAPLVWSAQVKWENPVIVEGKSNEPVIISGYQQYDDKKGDLTEETTYILYSLDYEDISENLQSYQRIYLTGQLVHGVLFVLVKK